MDPSGIGSYSNTDAQMQIQTNPFPGSVTSHATSCGGEFERIRYQIAAILNTTYWYQSAATASPTFGSVTVNGTTPAFILSETGTPRSQLLIDGTDTYLDFGGTRGFLFFRAGIGGTAVVTLTPTLFNIGIPVTIAGILNVSSNRIMNVATPTTANDAIPYGIGAVRGSTSNAGSAQDITQGTISTPDIRAQAISPALLGAVAGTGLTGGSGAVISANPDNVTININGSNQLQILSVTNSNSSSSGSASFPASTHVPTVVMSTSLTTLAGTLTLTTVSGKLTISGTAVAIRVQRDSTVIFHNTFTSGNFLDVSVTDTPGAGAHTYTFTIEASTDSPTVTAASTILSMTTTEFKR